MTINSLKSVSRKLVLVSIANDQVYTIDDSNRIIICTVTLISNELTNKYIILLGERGTRTFSCIALKINN